MKLSELLGVAPGEQRPTSKIGQALRRAGVRKTPEFARVAGLPRRMFDAADSRAYPDSSIIYAREACGEPGCSYCWEGAPRLKPIQNAMLIEAAGANGLFASVGVGGGKTIAGFLMHDALNARKTVLLVPPNLRDKTLKFDLPKLQRHFVMPPVFDISQANSGANGVYVIAYSELSATGSSDLLDVIEPDLVVADEAHNLRHKDAARTRRFLRFMRKNPCRFVGMSGSMATRSIVDFAHLVELALGKNSPLPADYPSLMEWADALDNEEASGEFGHTEPGALLEFCEPGEKVRDGFRRRLVETRGVTSTTERSCGANLTIKLINVTPPDTVRMALKNLHDSWSWDGEEFDQILEISRLARSLTQGFFYRAIWPGGEIDHEWRDARNAWKKVVRDRLSHSNRVGQDSPALLEAMAIAGTWTPAEWFAWQEQAHKEPPGKEAIEVSRWVVDYATRWQDGGPGIIWVTSPVLGAWLEEAKIPYFGEGADAELLELAEGKSAGTITIACSIQAHGTGKNLQKWSRNLVTYPPANGATWEQMIGRTHRPGQIADTVIVDLLLASASAHSAWDSAMSDARFAAETLDNPQLLLLATLVPSLFTV